MRIPPETIERIRTSTDVVALIGEHVRLTKSGRSFKGLCPFHTEKTPSFMINPERQTYHCFGCGVGGNAISFLIEYAKMSFPEAVRHLAERAGIEIPRLAEDAGREGESAQVLSALAFAMDFYRERLRHPYAGQAARDYLARRGLDRALAEEFGLGYAPDGWRNLLDRARPTFPAETLVKAGLAIPREGGTPYDRFRNRVMVPVANAMGKVVGFGGRALGEEEPKYINSPESIVYQKGQILFGLSQARESLHREDQAILVEGYMDHLRVFGNGFRNVVAVAGTAFTAHQAALLHRYVARVILVFDGDAAGLNASWRAVSLCHAAGLEARIGALPPEHDPDSLIRDRGRDAFAEILEEARTAVEFAATAIEPRAGREEALRRLVEVVREIPDPIRRRLYVQDAAERFRFDEATLVKAVEAGRSSVGSIPAAAPPPGPEIDRVERKLLGLVLGDSSLIGVLEGLSDNDFRDPLCRTIFQRITSPSSGRWTGDDVMAEEPESPLARLISEILVQPALGGSKAAHDYVQHLRNRSTKTRITALRMELQAVEKSGDIERSRAIRTEISELKKGTQTMGAKTGT